jgi:hypothetical protein
MTAFSHGALTFDLPPDWSDRTTLMFCAPKGADHGTVSLAVNRVEAETAATLLQATFDELKRVDDAVKLNEKGALKSGLGEGLFFDVTLTLGEVPVRQILGVVLKEGLAFRLTASAQLQHFDAAAPKLREILSSVRLG